MCGTSIGLVNSDLGSPYIKKLCLSEIQIYLVNFYFLLLNLAILDIKTNNTLLRMLLRLNEIPHSMTNKECGGRGEGGG